MGDAIGADLLESFSRKDAAELRRDPQAVAKRVRRIFGVHWLGFICLLGSSVAVLAVLGPAFAARHPLLLGCVVTVAIGRHVWDLYGLLGMQAAPLQAAPEELQGVLTTDDVELLHDVVSTKFAAREKPNVYIAFDKEANALTTNSLLLDFIPRYNAIYLNSYLFRALSPDELRAIVVHELAHFHRYASPLGRNAWLCVVGSVAACVLGFELFPAFADSLFAPLVFLWAPLPFIAVYGGLAGTGKRDLEYACDAIAAEVVGAESMINALLKIGDRAEIFELVEREMERQLEQAPELHVDELARDLLERLPEGPVTPEQALTALRSGPVADATGGDSKARKKLLEQFRRNRELRKALQVVRWRWFDSIRRDDSLEAAELHPYVRALGRHEFGATHEIAHDHPEEESFQSHPSIRKRIVYLYLHYLTPQS